MEVQQKAPSLHRNVLKAYFSPLFPYGSPNLLDSGATQPPGRPSWVIPLPWCFQNSQNASPGTRPGRPNENGWNHWNRDRNTDTEIHPKSIATIRNSHSMSSSMEYGIVRIMHGHVWNIHLWNIGTQEPNACPRSHTRSRSEALATSVSSCVCKV